MNVKEMLENEELMESIVEDIEDIPEDTEVTYEVWALGRDVNDLPTDNEILIGEFTDPDEAVKLAKKTTFKEVEELGYNKSDSNTACFSVEVETVVVDPDDESCGTMNIGTIYQRYLWPNDEEETELKTEVVDPVVELKSADFTITEDGELKISCKLLKNFNKNDYIRIHFVDEAEAGTFLYKIISKVEYKDGDYYHCDLEL